MMHLPDPNNTRGLALWGLLFTLLVESVWAINYLNPTGLAGTSLFQQIRSTPATPPEERNDSAVLALDPSEGTYTIGQVIPVKIILDTFDNSSDGLVVKLSYDPALLDVIDPRTGKPTDHIISKVPFPNEFINSVVSGEIVFSSASDPSGPFITSRSSIAEIYFRVKKAGTANIVIDQSPYEGQTSKISSHSNLGKDLLNKVVNAKFNLLAN